MPEPLYREIFDAQTLLRDHPPQFRHPHKAALFQLAYPDASALPCVIEVTRWAQHVEEPIVLPPTLASQVRDDFYDYVPVDDEAFSQSNGTSISPTRGCSPDTGRACSRKTRCRSQNTHCSRVCAKHCLQRASPPRQKATETGATPILVRNVERRIEVATDADAAAGRPGGLYGNRFADAPLDVVRRATRQIEPPTRSNIIAMAAPTGGHGDYTEGQIEYVFATAFTAFAAAVNETVRERGASCSTVVHSGFWGCGAFGGNRRLMVALQALAAQAAKVGHFIFHAGDAAGVAEAKWGLDVGDTLASCCGSGCSLDTLAGGGVMLAYRWGVSDGN